MVSMIILLPILDKNPGNEEASEMFKNLSTAYTVLSDPKQRRQYDLHGEDLVNKDLGSIRVKLSSSNVSL